MKPFKETKNASLPPDISLDGTERPDTRMMIFKLTAAIRALQATLTPEQKITYRETYDSEWQTLLPNLS